MKELRIALFTGNYNNISDGVSLTLNRWVAYLESRNIPVIIFAPTTEIPQLKHVGDLHALPSVPMPGRPEYRFSTGFPKSVRKKLDAFQPSLIHIATPDYAGFKALRYAQEHKIQVVASYHTHFTSYFKYYSLDWFEDLGWKYLRKIYRQVAHLYVPSRSMADELILNGIQDNIRIWARGVETDLFSPEKRDVSWRKTTGIPVESPLITFVSRLVWEKDLQALVETFRAVIAQRKECRLMVVGDGPAREELQRLLPEAFFPGFLRGDELARAYANSDVFFFPSVTETFGNVTLEAMSSGLPVVVADASGSKSLVVDGVNGFVLPPKDSHNFSEHILKLAADKELRTRMGKASREKALGYAWSNIHAQLLAYYEQALDAPLIGRPK